MPSSTAVVTTVLCCTGQYMTPTGEVRGDVFYFDYGVVAIWGLEKVQVTSPATWQTHRHISPTGSGNVMIRPLKNQI